VRSTTQAHENSDQPRTTSGYAGSFEMREQPDKRVSKDEVFGRNQTHSIERVNALWLNSGLFWL